MTQEKTTEEEFEVKYGITEEEAREIIAKSDGSYEIWEYMHK